MSDCCNAIAADGEAGAGCSHIGLMLHRPVMKLIPRGQKAANCQFLVENHAPNARVCPGVGQMPRNLRC